MLLLCYYVESIYSHKTYLMKTFDQFGTAHGRRAPRGENYYFPGSKYIPTYTGEYYIYSQVNLILYRFTFRGARAVSRYVRPCVIRENTRDTCTAWIAG